MRIFVGPTEIAGIGEGLSHGFADLGHHCDVVTTRPHPFKYGIKRPKPWFAAVWLHLHKELLRAGPKTTPGGFFWRAAWIVWPWVVLLASLLRYDAFIFLYGSTITGTELELRLLKASRKKIIFCYVGSDARPPYMDGGKYQPPFTENDIDLVYNETKRTACLVALHERYADEIISYHGICHFNRRKLVNWFEMGIPTGVDTCGVDQTTPVARKTVIALHSPSNPAVKGSAAIKAVVSDLKEKGLDLELRLLTGVPNAMVLAELAKCDFVIDQLYSDTPLAAFAAEAARLNKPAVVGGYFAVDAAQYIPAEAMPPSEFVPPDQLSAAIEKLTTNEAYRKQLGQRAKEFVTDRWSAKSVAKRYLRLLEGNVPDEWYFDPATTRYYGGCGLPHEAVTQLVQGVVSKFGDDSLLVDDKPALKGALLNMRLPKQI